MARLSAKPDRLSSKSDRLTARTDRLPSKPRNVSHKKGNQLRFPFSFPILIDISLRKRNESDDESSNSPDR